MAHQVKYDQGFFFVVFLLLLLLLLLWGLFKGSALMPFQIFSGCGADDSSREMLNDGLRQHTARLVTGRTFSMGQN